MRTFVLLVFVCALVAGSANAAGNSQTGSENSSWTSADETTVEERVAQEHTGFRTFQQECEEAVRTMKTALETYVHTVVTVVKTLFNAARTVLVSVLKLMVRFAVAFVLIAARWLLGLFLPV